MNRKGISYEDLKLLIEVSRPEHINEVIKGLCIDKESDVETLLWVSSKGEYDEATSN